MGVPISEFERFVNQVAADVEVQKVVFSAMIARLALTRGTEIVDDLEAISRRALEKGTPEASGDQFSHRLHQLKLSRADDYFRDLRKVIEAASGLADPMTKPPRRN